MIASLCPEMLLAKVFFAGGGQTIYVLLISELGLRTRTGKSSESWLFLILGTQGMTQAIGSKGSGESPYENLLSGIISLVRISTYECH